MYICGYFKHQWWWNHALIFYIDWLHLTNLSYTKIHTSTEVVYKFEWLLSCSAYQGLKGDLGVIYNDDYQRGLSRREGSGGKIKIDLYDNRCHDSLSICQNNSLIQATYICRPGFFQNKNTAMWPKNTSPGPLNSSTSSNVFTCHNLFILIWLYCHI